MALSIQARINRRRFIAATGGIAAFHPSLGETQNSARPHTLRGRWGDQGDGRYANPIIPADYSDVDVIKVSETYYAISSTLHTSPGMVVMQSADLVNWTVIGHAVPDISALGENLTWRSMKGYGRGVWAGSIRFHDGLFFVYFTCPDSGLFVTTASNPCGTWTPIKCLFPAPGYDDPCPLWEEDGRGYLVMTRFSADPLTGLDYTVRLFKLSEDGMRIDETSAKIIHHSAGSEGNKLYRIGGMYYHYFSEVKAEGRVAMMKRARTLDGPWEEQQLNHVKPAIDKEPNQGGFVQASDGRWWFLTHQGTGDWEGRALCLIPVTWQNGWPIVGRIGPDGIGNMVWESELPESSSPPILPILSDDFSEANLDPKWEWNHAPRSDMWSLSERPGSLRLSAFPPASTKFSGVGNVLAQRSWRTRRNVVVTLMDVRGMVDGQIGGLCHSSSTFAYIGVKKENGTKYIFYASDEKSIVGSELHQDRVWLKSIWDEGGNSKFSYSLDGRRFFSLGDIYKLKWGYYRGDRVGIFTFNELRAKGDIYFDNFQYHVQSQSYLNQLDARG